MDSGNFTDRFVFQNYALLCHIIENKLANRLIPIKDDDFLLPLDFYVPRSQLSRHGLIVN